ncbi:MAG: dienelactone hydrolase family protein [Pseudonocardiales bacterium]|nr:dienelactone hydrolase family protein [Pseudonocardiales bacterium]
MAHSPAFKLGRSLLNEVFWFLPHTTLSEVTVPTLIVHGTKDTFVSVESSRAAAAQLACEHKLVEIDGAQHGFTVHDDPRYRDPRTQEWQAFVIGAVTEWFMTGT